jgi:hypothetical protein
MRTSIIIVFLLLGVSLFAQTWHKKQISTGIGNCGPAAVAMAIQWATGNDFSVQRIRDEIGYTDPAGSTTFDELWGALKYFKVSAYQVNFSTLQEMKNMITNKSVLIVAVDLQKLYGETGGHYIVLYENRATVSDTGAYQEFAVADSLKPPNIYLSAARIWNALKYYKALRVFK